MSLRQGNKGFINVEIHLVLFFVLLLVIFILGGFWTRIIVAGISILFFLAWLHQFLSDRLTQRQYEDDEESK